MKKTNKLVAIMMSMILVLSMAVPVSAATHKLFIENSAPNHTYEAYQIFKGDLSTDATTLSNIEWGNGILDPAAFVNALVSDTKDIITTDTLGNNVTTNLSNVFVELNTEPVKSYEVKAKAKVVADILGKVANDSTVLDRFAELIGEVNYSGSEPVYQYLNAANKVLSGNITTQGEKQGYLIEGMETGYYLIKDSENSAGAEGNTGDFYTKYIVRVVKDDNIKVKGEGVKVEKSVNDTLDGTYTEYEDADTNDTVYFKLEGTLPNNLASYDTYSYSFRDKMSGGLGFLQIEQIYIENNEGVVAHKIYDITDEDTGNNTLPTGADNKIELIQPDGEYTFSLAFTDLFKNYSSLKPTHKVIVKYSARVNRDAIVNTSNTNSVIIEYSNNPNGEGTGTTTSDNAHVFTFHINVDKYDAADNKIKLEGVEFKLYKEVTVESDTVKYYAKVITEEMIDKGVSINGKPCNIKDLGVVYEYTTNKDDAAVLDTDANGYIGLKGLDAGIYYLEETKTVDGYNRLTTPVQIEIVPTYTVEGENATVKVKYEVDGMDQGDSSTVGVRNSKGSTLPSTGGMGTTVLYIAGGALVLCAIVLLITKKRMAAKK